MASLLVPHSPSLWAAQQRGGRYDAAAAARRRRQRWSQGRARRPTLAGRVRRRSWVGAPRAMSVSAVRAAADRQARRDHGAAARHGGRRARSSASRGRPFSRVSRPAIELSCSKCAAACGRFAIPTGPTVSSWRRASGRLSRRSSAPRAIEPHPAPIWRFAKATCSSATARRPRPCDRDRPVARTDFTVLIEGESGVGKEVAARQIHLWSRRARGPFVAVNCAALVESLLEAELFGIEDRTATGVRGRRGKFEQADGGTLFLDEVADLSSHAQAKLLRALQEFTVERVGGHHTRRLDIRLDRGDQSDAGLTRPAGTVPPRSRTIDSTPSS